MSKLIDIMNNENIPSYVTPLFWQHGESETVLRQEIRQMHENGIGSFIVESRPHPGFLKEEWWRDMDILLDEAKKRNMRVWIFDDNAYPSGFSAGLIKEKHPEYLKVYIRECHIDAKGPLVGSSFIVNAWIEQDESLIRVIAARRANELDNIDGSTLIDITSRMDAGILYWDVPDGDWRVFIIKKTRDGGEEWTKDYLNPLDPDAVKAYLDFVYEPHYKKYGYEFGKTIAGFFSDEPRFGNAPTYEATLGKQPMVLPWWDKLMTYLDKAFGGDFSLMLPCLWYEAGEVTSHVRYIYMDTVSGLFGKNMAEQIGDWCRAHRVELIGHVVEDNGAHSRLGYGSGHFFRALRGQDCSGMDLVSQVWPGYTSGKVTTPFGFLDANFFYWGIAKMASSEGHIDVKKKGRTVCEIYGAYGWQEGLKLMKWLTDFVCVRGINIIIPHAFSPKYHDTDCPPHFYARGENPQWKYFHVLATYINRVCHLLSDGTHVAPVAVVYHAEAEWSGDYQPFEDIVGTLARRQIDCDVIPIDTLVNKEEAIFEESRVRINNETYKAIIVPYSQHIPGKLAERLMEAANNDVKVIFMKNWPEASCNREKNFVDSLSNLKKNMNCSTMSEGELADKLISWGMEDVHVEGNVDSLRYYHYTSDLYEIYFFTNESKHKTVHTTLRFRENKIPVLYDAMEGIVYSSSSVMKDGLTEVELKLEPYESVFIIFGDEMPKFIKLKCMSDKNIFSKDIITIDQGWKVSVNEAGNPGLYKREPKISGLGNISKPGILPEFSGTVLYETEFEIGSGLAEEELLLDLGQVYEIAEVSINGQSVGTKICPPYRFNIKGSLKSGRNTMQVYVTNTLAKKFGRNLFDRAMPQEPSGLIGPVRILK